MRILVLNPNTSTDVTARLSAAAKQAAAEGTVIATATATRGVPYIATRAEAQIGGAIALEMLAEVHREYDAAIVAAFGDPGLFGARELFDIPVVGMAEASMLTACMLGRRFAIVTFARALGPWYQECVDMHGLAGRCAGIRMLDDPFDSIGDVQDEKEDLLVELAGKAAQELDADAIILAGAPLAGLAIRVRDRLPFRSSIRWRRQSSRLRRWSRLDAARPAPGRSGDRTQNRRSACRSPSPRVSNGATDRAGERRARRRHRLQRGGRVATAATPGRTDRDHFT
jgi:allantoin racemase